MKQKQQKGNVSMKTKVYMNVTYPIQVRSKQFSIFIKGVWKYSIYLARHKWFVFIAGRKTGTSIIRLIIHDWSKLLPIEFFSYAAYFYGEHGVRFNGNSGMTWEWNEADKVHRKFNVGWLHHLKINKHHWNYWILNNDDGTVIALPMPEKYVKEMVADWMGAGRAITGHREAYTWFQNNQKNMSLHEWTLDKIMTTFKTIGYGIATNE